MKSIRAYPWPRLASAVIAAIALLPSCLMAQELDCPGFAEPARARLQWVAPFMIFNGVPMSVKRFDSEQRPEEILAFYRQIWRGAGSAAPVENTVEPWQVISVLRGKCFFTVQVQSAGRGSAGLLSATQAQGQQAKLTPPEKVLPMMTGSTVINDIEHRDEGKNARTILLANGFSAETNAGFYRQNLADRGWKMVNSYQMTTKRGPGITLVMKRGATEASLVITREGQNTMVMANLVDNP